MRNQLQTVKIGEIALNDFNSRGLIIFVRGQNIHLQPVDNKTGSTKLRRLGAIDFQDIDSFCELLQKAKIVASQSSIEPEPDWLKNQRDKIPWIAKTEPSARITTREEVR